MKTALLLTKVVFAVALVTAVIMAFDGNRSPSFVYLAVFFLVTNTGAAFLRGVRARQRSRAYDRDENAAKAAPLAAGDCVLHGKVAYARGASEAMRMEFVQTGSESESSGSWSHNWKELSRKLTVQPFYVVRPDGTRVRVEPSPNQSRLFDELESKILVRSELGDAHNVPTNEPVRGRVATLVPDETVWVTGRLVHGQDPEDASAGIAGAYRASARPASWVLVGSPTLLVSSVSLAKHFAERARRHFRDAVLYALCLAGPLFMGNRYLDRVNGETLVGTVERVTEVTNDDNQVTGHVAHARHARGVSETETLDEAPAVGSKITFRVGESSDNVGPVARFSVNEMVLAFVILCGCIGLRCLLFGFSAHALPWYRSDRIRMDEGGSGRLKPGVTH